MLLKEVHAVMDDEQPTTEAPAPEPVDASADLSALSIEELQSRESELVAQFDAADEADDLDEMSSIADQIDAVRAEIERKGGEGEAPAPAEVPTEPEAVAASAESPEEVTTVDDTQTNTEAPVEQPETEEVPGVPGEEVPAEETPEGEGGEEEAVPTEGEQPVAEAPADAVTTQPDAAAVAASGSTPEGAAVDVPEDRQPVVTEPVSTIVAGADLGKYAMGSHFENGLQIAEAMCHRIDAVRSVRSGSGEQHIVATIVASAPADRILESADFEANLGKIEAVVRKEAITAAGGYCAPLETRYDIFGTGTTDRPVRDALAGFQAKRGGIRYTSSPKIADFSSAIGLWTAANDANPTTPTEKPCMIVECNDEVTATLDAVTLCLQYGNLMTRAFPELVDRNNQLALVAHARFAERTLLSKLTALSTAVTSAMLLGTTRDFLFAIGRAAAAYRNRYRMEPSQSLRVIAPIWVRDAMREDLAMQAPGDDALAVADNVIDGYLRARNVNVSWHLDGTGFNDEVAASTLDSFPATFDWYIFAEGAFLFLDGGTLDLGVVRDAALVGTNDYKTFTETFEGVARIGAESIKVTTTTAPAGAYALGVDTIP